MGRHESERTLFPASAGPSGLEAVPNPYSRLHFEARYEHQGMQERAFQGEHLRPVRPRTEREEKPPRSVARNQEPLHTPFRIREPFRPGFGATMAPIVMAGGAAISILL
ncbi:MAG: hypothetical protein ACE5F4_02725 [Candidatus Paceibacteria bacterium]